MFGRKKKNQGKHSLVDVIRYDGPQDGWEEEGSLPQTQEVFIWKHPCEDFNTNSQLIVHESQEAIFFCNGKALDRFKAGEHVLRTENLPLLRSVIGLATGGETPFHCEVYFINKAVSMGLPWGTNAPIGLVDPEHGLPIEVTAYGDFSLRVSDGRKLLLKLVGTMKQYTHEEIGRYFTGIMSMHVKDCIANAIEKKKVSALHINTMLRELSSNIKEAMEPVYAGYGLELNHFVVSGATVRGLEELGDALKKARLDTIAGGGRSGADQGGSDRKRRLMELKEWFEDGLITEEEYRQNRARILESL